MAGDDGFQVVSRGGRPRRHVSSATVLPSEDAPQAAEIVSAVLLSREETAMAEYADRITELLEDVHCEALICYGIGLFGTCRIARLQLALLLHIASAKQGREVQVYDPLLRPQERAALKELQCVCIPENELCRRQVKTRTLFYMPHCGRAMYDNLLWANWSPEKLTQVALIGNSFQSYLERTLQQKIEFTFSYLFRAAKYCQEKALPSYIEPTIFNDLSVHTFPLDRLVSAPSSLWMPHNAPPPDPSDPEIIAT